MARAAVTVRQARENSLHDTNRFTALCDSLETLTSDEWTLGRQLVAFAGNTGDRHALVSTVERIGLDILADTAGLPTAATVQRCRTCHGIPGFAVRRPPRSAAGPACRATPPGGYEIASLAASQITIDRANSLSGRTLVSPEGSRFRAGGFSIEAGAYTATLRLTPIDEHGQPTSPTWTRLLADRMDRRLTDAPAAAPAPQPRPGPGLARPSSWPIGGRHHGDRRTSTDASRDRRAHPVPARAVSPETALPQPTDHPVRIARAAIPAQRRSTTSLSRQLAEQDWRTLVATVRLLQRLQLERAKHHLLDEAEAFGREAERAEQDLENHFPARWARLKPRLAGEFATWQAQDHGPDPLTCRACRIQNRPPEQQVSVPPPNQSWFT